MTSSQILDLPTAYDNRKHATANWDDISGEFSGDVWPMVKPSFSIQASDTVFTIGSCFARNIEDNLARLGCRVPMLDFQLPPEEWHGRANGALNRFTPPTFRQALEWTIAVHRRGGVVQWEEDCAPIAFDCGGGAYYDLDLVPTNPVTRDRFLERRQHVYDVFKSALTADCFMMTPGFIEAWRDLQTGLYIQGAPKHRRVIAAGPRFQFEVLSYEQSYQDLLATIDLVREHNPAVKILVTTSPVPLGSTFTGQDVRIANTYSKSVLRAACGRLALERAGVDYFPSYESVTLTAPEGVWKDDRIHVSTGFIGKIVTRLSKLYLSGVELGDAALQEAETAMRNGQVDQAIAGVRVLLAEHPDNLAGHILLIDCLMKTGQWAAADQELRPLLVQHPDQAALHYRLARTVMRRGKKHLPEALELARIAAALPSATVKEISWAIGLLVRHVGALDEAEALARVMIERFPRHAAAYQPLVDILLAAGRDDEARELLVIVVDLPNQLALNWLQSARLRLKAGDYQEARTHALMAARRNPEEPGLAEVLAAIDSATAGAPDGAATKQA